ncbi:cobyric acid synthase [Sulfidibacter corallicola]|uniref:Cobyric acid synthase n=1 Tax=Sulfidibacter corallicola TaxID=2818388 RepID=A0A8A4TUE5_SULCO|nr:cobyric acid synthase [Sulfidibacter corallicola]QTD52731.1 cobyric acid synthase [Sulfidibacter corallicola]
MFESSWPETPDPDGRSPASRCLSVLGTASDVGKSVVTTALCRIFRDLGYRTAPFKAQNMSNNAGVTPDGGEIGRAQIVQAEAAGAVPDPDMNPVLLKPNTDTGSQVVLHGRAIGNREAGEYFGDTSVFRREALASLQRLRNRYDMVVMEGAGSCAEINLRDRDFVNFDMAHAADCPVLLVADIDRGGVFAQVVGTLEVIPQLDRARVAGILINRFRGDIELFRDGIRYLEGRTRLPVLGVIPWFHHIEIDPEDALPVPIVRGGKRPLNPANINVAVIRLPHISNFTDFSPLQREPEVDLRYPVKPIPLDGYDLVLLPGSKNSRFDLDWLRRSGWEAHLREYVSNDGRLAGLCGGYQMLGQTISDPTGVEGVPGTSAGLGYLPIHTTLDRDKLVRRASGTWLATGDAVRGYEIHVGRTEIDPGTQPLIEWHRTDEASPQYDGAFSEEGRVWGCYLHGLFDEPALLERVLGDIRPGFQVKTRHAGLKFRERQYGLLADHFREHMDLTRLFHLVGHA